MYNFFAIVGKLKEIDLTNSKIKMSTSIPFRDEENFVEIFYTEKFDEIVKTLKLEVKIGVSGYIKNDNNSQKLIAEKIIYIQYEEVKKNG